MLHVGPVVNDELLVLIYCNRKILTNGAGVAVSVSIDVGAFVSLKPARQRHVLDARVAATNGVMQQSAVQRATAAENAFLVIVLT